MEDVDAIVNAGLSGTTLAVVVTVEEGLLSLLEMAR